VSQHMQEASVSPKCRPNDGDLGLIEEDFRDLLRMFFCQSRGAEFGSAHGLKLFETNQIVY
jgi:hypothetical protein